MRIRKVGDYQYKGDAGFYAVDVDATPPRYTAIDWREIDDALFRAIDRKEVVDLSLEGTLWYARVDQCLGQ